MSREIKRITLGEEYTTYSESIPFRANLAVDIRAVAASFVSFEFVSTSM
jgi:hypothetical protein